VSLNSINNSSVSKLLRERFLSAELEQVEASTRTARPCLLLSQCFLPPRDFLLASTSLDLSRGGRRKQEQRETHMQLVQMPYYGWAKQPAIKTAAKFARQAARSPLYQGLPYQPNKFNCHSRCSPATEPNDTDECRQSTIFRWRHCRQSQLQA